MRDDVPDQPGAAVRVYRTVRRIDMGRVAEVYEIRRRSSPRIVIEAACLIAVVAMIVLSRAGPAWAQPEMDDILEIPVHPRVATIVHLPDQLTRSRVNPGAAMRVTLIGRTLHVRPDAGVPTGLEALLEVETTTMLLTFRLRVVERIEDARRELVVVALKSEQRAEAGPLGIEDTPAGRLAIGLMAPPSAVRFAAEKPAPRVSGPPPAPPIPAEPIPAPISTAPRAPLELSVHAVGGLGFTGLEIARYQPETAVRRHHSLGLRLIGEPRDTWWALEASIIGERPAGSMRHGLPRAPTSELVVSGPLFRFEAGMRAGVGTIWRASTYAGIGMQVHLRRTLASNGGSRIVDTMEPGAVLALGIGLQHRVRSKFLLGIDFQVRQGGPDDYLSAAAFLTIGRFLDQGD